MSLTSMETCVSALIPGCADISLENFELSRNLPQYDHGRLLTSCTEVAYTRDFKWYHSAKSSGFRSGQRGGQGLC